MTNAAQRSPGSTHLSSWKTFIGLFLGMVLLVALYAAWRGDGADASLAAEEAKAAPQEPVQKPEPPPAKQPPKEDERPKVAAPELQGGIEWLNTAGPIRLRDLKGKIVLLDFWTYCCINCIHVLPDLAKLEKKYPNELVVIGVHSAKFDTEKDSKNIREAILRYNIEHPVINDADHKIWNAYSVRSWPTFWVIDPEGNLHGRGSGEGLFEALDENIAKLIEVHRAKKTLNEQPMRFDLAKFKERKTSPLFFPGKLLADAATQRLFIADSSHNRIVITDLAGKKLDVIGTGGDGAKDGGYGEATFNDPQGMALRGDVLYVADRKNHLLRTIDLKAKKVATFAGTGEQGFDRQAGGPARRVGLNSPWDLWHHGEHLYVAMAGHHQIWRMNVTTNVLEPYAGNGREDLLDGSLARSNFAQPSGFASDGKSLFVADSEVSAIRVVPLAQGDVTTLVGEGLFDFGDVDGPGDKARLQHALAVAFYEGKVYVADTYNNKIKTIDVATKECSTFLGDKKPGKSDDPPQFDEPAGMSLAGHELYLADTNNHAIRVIDLKTKKVRTLALQGVEPPAEPKAAAKPHFPNPTIVKLDEVKLPRDGEVTIQVDVTLPPGFKLGPEAPLTYFVEAVGTAIPWEQAGRIDEPKLPFEFKLTAKQLADAKSLKFSLAYFVCQEGGEGICKIESVVWEGPVRFAADAKDGTVRLRMPKN